MLQSGRAVHPAATAAGIQIAIDFCGKEFAQSQGIAFGQKGFVSGVAEVVVTGGEEPGAFPAVGFGNRLGRGIAEAEGDEIG
jgi:hypothetical protein